LINKSNLIDRLYYDLIRFFAHLVVAYVIVSGHPVFSTNASVGKLFKQQMKHVASFTGLKLQLKLRLNTEYQLSSLRKTSRAKKHIGLFLNDIYTNSVHDLHFNKHKG